MVDRTNILAQFSSALVERSVAANSAIAAIRLRRARHITGMLWRPDAVITSEQSLPEREEFELVTADGSAIKAKMAGRDPGTNLAVLKPERPLSVATAIPAASHVGALAIAFGADAGGTATPRLGVVNAIGPEWHSSHGGRIEQRVELDIDLARREEGGPVFDASGGLLGMSTFGPRRQVIIIPAATIERVVPILFKDGRVSRGWLGVRSAPGRCAGRTRGWSIERLNGHVAGRGRPCSERGDCGRRYRPQCRRCFGASDAQHHSTVGH